MSIDVVTNLDYLIDGLRLHLWDVDSTAYRYTDNWLRTALVASVKQLQGSWSYRYLIDLTTYNVSRNPHVIFLFPEPPIIQAVDEKPIILQASIIIKSGSLQNHAWDIGSWRDAEISYSNISGGSELRASLEKDIAELYSIIKPPQKKLIYPSKAHLPGYLNNEYERSKEIG